jgi:hypothetical protein
VGPRPTSGRTLYRSFAVDDDDRSCASEPTR